MPKQSIFRIIKRWHRYKERGDWEHVRRHTRGLYVLYRAAPAGMFEAVYIGVAGIGQNSGGDILSRLKIQNRFKKKGWTHYSMFEVHDNVTREEIRELEALLLAIFRDDPRIELANKQKGSKRLDELCKPSQWKGS